MTNVSIGGNVTDSVMVFGNDNYVVKIGDVNGGVVNIVKPTGKQKYLARSTPVKIKPRAFPSLLDRENEIQAIKRASQLSIPVSIWGEDGVGKTSFIRHLVHTLEAGNFTSGVVFLDASGLGYEDLLQALFDLFFVSDPSYKPTVADIIPALQNIKALVFLDDIQIGRDEVPSILDAAPNSLFILSSKERSLWGEGEVISLRGLPESESLKLFEKELSRPLNDQEKLIAIKICSMLQGNPLRILQAASLIRENGKPVEDLLTEMTNERTEDKSMAFMSMASLSDLEKQILALLAAAGGNIISLEHIKAIFKGGGGQNKIQKLITLGLVQAHSPRFSITDTMVSSISAAWDLSSWQDILLSYAINWLSQQPASTLVEESSGFLIHAIKSAGERKKWREVIQLGCALEKFLIFYKRWQSWSDILNLILTAAKALNDRKVQAWALHQLGSRALYLGYTNEAKTFLSQALSIRRTLGDKAGLAVTRHNLNILNGIIVPPRRNAPGCRRYITCGVGTIAGFGILTAITLVTFFYFSNYNISFDLPVEPPIIPTIIRPTDIPVPFEPPTLMATDIPSYTPSPTTILTSTPTNMPSATWTQTSTNTFTSIPGAIVQFWAEPASIQAGSCTTIRWHVENAIKVVFGGNRQPFDGSYQDCICSDQLYTLHVTELNGAEVKQTVNINVSGTCVQPATPSYTPKPIDTVGPPKPYVNYPKNNVLIACPPSKVTLDWDAPSDPSGIASYWVVLYEGSTQIESWPTVTGTNLSIQKPLIDCGHTYIWKVSARDGAGNLGSYELSQFQMGLP